MSLVLDASLTVAWFFADERTPAANDVLSAVTTGGAQVPGLWRLEVANTLQVGVRRKRIDAAFRDQALQRLTGLPIVIDPDTSITVAFWRVFAAGLAGVASGAAAAVWRPTLDV